MWPVPRSQRRKRYAPVCNVSNFTNHHLAAEPCSALSHTTAAMALTNEGEQRERRMTQKKRAWKQHLLEQQNKMGTRIISSEKNGGGKKLMGIYI